MTRLIWVFLVVFLLSAVWHLPASWLYEVTEAETHLPKSFKQKVKIQQINGSWWQGKVRLSIKDDGWLDVGQVAWTWQPSALLDGDLGLALDWMLSENEQISLFVATNGQHLSLQEIDGSAKVAKLAQFHAVTSGLLGDAGGEVFFKNMALELPLGRKKVWPQSIAGKLVLSQFSAMGMEVERIKVTPELQKSLIQFNVDGGGKGWQLTGHSQVIQPNRFKHNLLLKADKADTMPDWASLVMRQKSNIRAELRTKGRF